MFDKQRNWLTILFWILLLGTFIVFYVDNVIKINGLVKEIQKLKTNYAQIKEKNVILKKRINELEAPEYIIEKATTKFGMVYPRKVPKSVK